MFLAELTRKLAHKRKQEEEEDPQNNIVRTYFAINYSYTSHKIRKVNRKLYLNYLQYFFPDTIIDSITNALPVIVSRKSPEKKESPMKIETLQTFAPELLSKDTVDIPVSQPNDDYVMLDQTSVLKQRFKIPRMPVTSSDVLKPAVKKDAVMEDVAVNTGGDHDVASEIAKHVSTLRKISLIAEEFNQKTGKYDFISNCNL